MNSSLEVNKVEIECLHYRDSGLENLYLANGWQAIDNDLEKGLTIMSPDSLFRSVMSLMISDMAYFTGADSRFIRRYLDISKEQLEIICDLPAGSVLAMEETQLSADFEQSIRCLCAWRLRRPEKWVKGVIGQKRKPYVATWNQQNPKWMVEEKMEDGKPE